MANKCGGAFYVGRMELGDGSFYITKLIQRTNFKCSGMHLYRFDTAETTRTLELEVTYFPLIGDPEVVLEAKGPIEIIYTIQTTN